MSPHLRNENGFALAAALLALVIVGALVTGGFVAASSEGRMGTGSRLSADAFYAADQGVDALLGSWTTTDFRTAMPNPGDSVLPLVDVPVQTGGAATGTYTVGVRRLTNELFFILSTGRVEGRGLLAGAERRVATLVRLFEMSVPMDRAFQSWGGVQVKGSALISGKDLALPVPDSLSGCQWKDTTVNAVVVSTGAKVSQQKPESIIGDTISEPFSLDDFEQFGNLSLQDLKAQADIVLDNPGNVHLSPAVDANGNCDRTRLTNWGDPTNAASPCFGYMPIIHIKGTVKLNASGVGQGILIVDGDLEMTGGVEFYGIAIVAGKFWARGTGGHINGIVIARDGGEVDTINEMNGNAEVHYSSCSIKRAIEGTSLNRAIPLAERSWIDLSAAGTGV